jgi:hypothetical protein
LGFKATQDSYFFGKINVKYFLIRMLRVKAHQWNANTWGILMERSTKRKDKKDEAHTHTHTPRRATFIYDRDPKIQFAERNNDISRRREIELLEKVRKCMRDRRKFHRPV